MLFFSLAENTNFSAQSCGVAEGTEFTITFFTIMALTFPGNKLGGKEYHWVPSDKSAGLAAAANYLAGRKGCVPGIHRRVCELLRMGKTLWCLCHANWRMAPIGSCLTFTSSPLLSRHFFLPIMIPTTLKSTLGYWQFAREKQCLWNNAMPRTKRKGKQNITLCCK